MDFFAKNSYDIAQEYERHTYVDYLRTLCRTR